jgi:hypothetical protein
MVFPVTDNHVVSATLDHLLVVVNDLHMVTGHHDLIAQIAQDMQTVVSETNVLPMLIVPSGEIVLHTANAVNVPDMEIVMVLPVANAHVMVTVTVHPAEIVHPMVTAMRDLNVGDMTAVVALTVVVLHEEIVPVESVMVVHLLETETIVLPMVIVPSVVTVLHMVSETLALNAETVLLMEIVSSVQSVLAMATVDLVRIAESVHPIQIVGHALSVQNAPHMVIVHNVVIVPRMGTVVLVQSVLNALVLVIVVVVPTARVHHVLGVVKTVLVGKNQNSLQNRRWHANYAWFAHTTMIPGLMMMSPVMNSTRLHATSSRL